MLPFYHIQKYFCLLSLQDQCEALKQYFVIKQQVSQLVSWCFEPVSHHNTTILCITITSRREQVPVYEQDWKALLLLLLWPNPGRAVLASHVGSENALKTCLMLHKSEIKLNREKPGMLWRSLEFLYFLNSTNNRKRMAEERKQEECTLNVSRVRIFFFLKSKIRMCYLICTLFFEREKSTRTNSYYHYFSNTYRRSEAHTHTHTRARARASARAPTHTHTHTHTHPHTHTHMHLLIRFTRMVQEKTFDSP